MTVILWPAIFLITVLETLISTWEGRADRRSTTSKTRRLSMIAANWAGSFELVLFVDILVVVHEGWRVMIPILAGAWIGKFYACEQRRKKFRANAGRLRKKARRGTISVSQPEGGTSATQAAAVIAPTDQT